MRYNQGRRFVQEIEPQGKIVLFGTSYDGISHEGFYLREGQDPYEVLGECELADQYIIALRSGLSAADILLFRLNGIKGQMTLFNSLDNTPLLDIQSIGASEKDQDITIMVSPEGLVVFMEHEVLEQRSYRFDDYETTRDLVRAINRDADFGLSEVEARLVNQRILNTCVFQQAAYPFYMASGEEELVRTEETDIPSYVESFYQRFLEASALDETLNENSPVIAGELFSVPAEVISLVGIFHDEHLLLAKALGEYCEKKSEETKIMTLGVIGVNAIPDKTELMDYGIDENGNMFDEEDNLYIYEPWKERHDFLDKLMAPVTTQIGEAGRFVHVVIGQHQTVRGIASIGPAYAANYVQNEVGKSFTNKEIKGIGEFLYNLQKKELVGLESNGYICTVPSIRRNVVSKKSQSFYTYEVNTYKAKPHLIRLAYQIGRDVERRLEQYVGESSTMDVTASETLLRDQFNTYVKEGLLKSYELLITRPELARIHVQINLVPYGSTESIALEQEVRYEEKEVFRWMDV